MLLLRVGPLGLGPLELVIILLVLVMLFGASRLADIGGSLGKGIKEFRREVSADESGAAGGDGGALSTNAGGTVQAQKCSSCGSLNAASARHCNQCGAALGASVEQS